MSEEAKLVYIQMRMMEMERMEHVLHAGLWAGILLTVVGFVFSGLGYIPGATANGFWFWLGVVGIIIAAVHLYGYALNSYQYFKLKQESKTMTEASPSSQ